MKLLLLGAHGFIGRHTAVALASLGHEVTRADITPSDDPGYLTIDAHNPDFAALFQRHSFDVCINCSGAASVPQSFADPAHDFTLNTLRVVQILEALRVAGGKTRLLHLSSAAVYGNPVTNPICEDDAPRPVSPYGWHKLHAEQICREYSNLHGVGTLSLRIFSAFGPGLRKQLFWDIFQKARRGQRVDLSGTGEETRDFIFVEDIAACIGLLIRDCHFDGRAVNVASGEAVTVRTAATALLAALRWDRELVFSGDKRLGDPSFWRADISSIRNLGFRPAHTLEHGLEKVAQWMLQS